MGKEHCTSTVSISATKQRDGRDLRLTNSCVVLGSSRVVGELCPESALGEDPSDEALGVDRESCGLRRFAASSFESAGRRTPIDEWSALGFERTGME